ncbi:MAG: hypothetical protein O7G87_15335 [bacterium]|nr:hypothetical protein [bacterium]
MTRYMLSLLVLVTALSCGKIPPVVSPLHFPGTYTIERQTVVNGNRENTFIPPTIVGTLILTETRFTFDVLIPAINSREFSEGTYTTVGNVILLNITNNESFQATPPAPESSLETTVITVAEQIIELSQDSQRITISSTLTSGNETARSIMVFVRVSA